MINSILLGISDLIRQQDQYRKTKNRLNLVIV